MPVEQPFYTQEPIPGFLPTIEIDESSFKKGDKLDKEVHKRLHEVNDRLRGMVEHLKKEKLDTDELRVASLAIEKELNDSIPPQFWKEYREAKSENEAAALITGKILTNVNHFIGEVIKDDLTGTGKLMDPEGSRLHAIIHAVDIAPWSTMDRKKAGEIYTDIQTSRSKTPTQAEVEAFMERYRSQQWE